MQEKIPKKMLTIHIESKNQGGHVMSVATEELQKELVEQRLSYLRWFMGDIAKLSDAIAKEIGEQKYQDLLFTTRCGLAQNWTSSMAKQRQEEGKENTIEDLIDAFWEPLEKEDYTFTSVKKNDGSYHIEVTNCIIANVAKELGIEQWMYVYFCKTWECEANGFNPGIGLTLSKTLMQGDDHCSFCYYWKNV